MTKLQQMNGDLISDCQSVNSHDVSNCLHQPRKLGSLQRHKSQDGDAQENMLKVEIDNGNLGLSSKGSRAESVNSTLNNTGRNLSKRKLSFYAKFLTGSAASVEEQTPPSDEIKERMAAT